MKYISLLVILVTGMVSAQTWFPMREGAVLEYRYYNNKGRALRDAWRDKRFTRLTVEKTWGDSVANVAIWNEAFERLKGDKSVQDVVKALSYGDVVVGRNEVIFENVMWTFLPENLAYTVDYGEYDGNPWEVTMNAAARVPRVLNVGDTLPEMRYKAVLEEQVTPEIIEKRRKEDEGFEERMLAAGTDYRMPTSLVVEHTAMVRNRRVEGREKIGEYDCWKTSYEMVDFRELFIGFPQIRIGEDGMATVDYTDNWMPMIIKYIDYLSPEVGLVSREEMNGTGRRIDEVMMLESVEYQ